MLSKESAVTKRWRGRLGLLLLVPVMLLAGCTAEGTYRGGASTSSYSRDIPPALSGTDPALSQWYTAPYFDPYEMP
jgi:hypothetical protein